MMFQPASSRESCEDGWSVNPKVTCAHPVKISLARSEWVKLSEKKLEVEKDHLERGTRCFNWRSENGIQLIIQHTASSALLLGV